MPNYLNKQKVKIVRISKVILNLLNDGGYRFISKTVTGDEIYLYFLASLRVKKVE